MTPSRMRSELQNLLNLLVKAEIALSANSVVERRYGGRVRITWPGNTPGAVFRSDFTEVSAYYRWIETGAYSAILYDGGILQLTYDFQGDDIVGHRLAYHPCPFELDREALEMLRREPILDVLELYKDSMEHIRLRSPIRFDYDSSSRKEVHPASHLTILWPHCRWPVWGPVSPGHFIRFVFKHFYPELWQVHDFIRKWPQRQGLRTITDSEEEMMHVACVHRPGS